MSRRVADDDEGEVEVARVAMALARVAEEERLALQIRLAQIALACDQSWIGAAWPWLVALGEALGGGWDATRSDTRDLVYVAGHLADLGVDHDGRARAALDQAANAVADLARLRELIPSQP